MRFWYLFKRELQSLFLSPIAAAVGTLFLFLNGVWLTMILFNATQGVPASASFVYQNWLASLVTWMELWVLIPIITMRLMSEEKRQGSLELLLTAPVSDLSIILSKWLGALGFFILLWSPSLIVFLLLRLYAPTDFRPFMTSLLMIALIGALWCAVGLLFSTLTAHMAIAALLTGAAFFASLLIGVISNLPLDSFQLGNAKGLAEFFLGACKQFNVLDAMGVFAKGTLDSRNLVFYLSMTALTLLTTHQILAARRYRG
jgi:ABC-2 type transport system permease protein